MAELKFLRGLASNFSGLTKDANSFYVVEHKNNENEFVKYELYLGDKLIADGSTVAELAAEVTRAKEVEDGLKARLDALDGGSSASGGTIEAQIKAAIEGITGTLGDSDAATLEALNDRIDSVEANAKTYSIKAVEKSGLSNNILEAFILVDEDDVQVGQQINIYRDSALKNVELKGEVIEFTYVKADGTDQVIEVDVSKFLAESEFKDGFNVENNVVSVNLGEDRKNDEGVIVSKNFIEFEADGAGNQAIALRSIDTDSTVLQKDIRVAGLSGQFGAGNYSNDQVIPAGTDIYTILQNILCKELWATNVKSSDANITSSVAAPTISLSKTGVLTYGTPMTVNSVTCGALTVKTSANTVSNLTYGYSASDDDSVDSTATTITKSVTSSITDSTYDLSVTFSGFNGQSTLTASGSSSDSCNVGSTSIGMVTMGSNKITATQTGPVVKGVADGIESGYTASNLGNTDASKKYPAVNAFEKELARPVSTASTTVTGVLPCFINISDGAFVDDASVQMALTTGATFNNIKAPSEVAASKHFMFDFPADRTVTAFKVKDLQGNFVNFEAAYSQQEFDEEGNEIFVEKTINDITMKYRRLKTTGSYVGDGEYQITLSTNLNTATIDNVVKK